MKRGKVCEKHQEFSPDGECRWCEPPPSEVPATLARGAFGISGTNSQWAQAQQQAAQQGLGASPLTAMPPLPVASCKHDGALLDFSGTISCAACGKVISAPVAPLVIHYLNCAATIGGPCTCLAIATI